MKITTLGMTAAAWLLAIGMAAAAPAPDSKHMSRAKEFIDDEQWSRAAAELQAAVADPKEANRDEALFWLAYSQHQAGDEGAALESLAALERTAPSSRWVRLGRSLRMEIAQVLRREDMIRFWANLPAPPVPPTPAQPAPPARPGMAPYPVRPGTPPPALPAPGAPAPAAPPAPTTLPPAPPEGPPSVVRVRPTPRSAPTPPAPPAPNAPPAPAAPSPWKAWPNGTEIWMPLGAVSRDPMLKVQALSMLVDAHGEQAIPLLREIALDRSSPDEARQAVFVLAQSSRPEARRTVVEVARQGAEPVRIAAVRELGHLDGPMISTELMQVYTMGNAPVLLKRQVVSSLGERADNVSLVRIVRSESEPTLRDFAIRTLGRTGARDQLRLLYGQAPRVSRAAVLNALCAAKDDDELIRIARTEQDGFLRMRARDQLRLLATPKAVKFLEENP